MHGINIFQCYAFLRVNGVNDEVEKDVTIESQIVATCQLLCKFTSMFGEICLQTDTNVMLI